MSRGSFVSELEQAADRIADMPRADLQVLLRRAAILIRNLPPIREGPLDPEIAIALETVIAGDRSLDRTTVIRKILRDWLVTSGHLLD
ncbi:MAG: hypothetical protein H0T56_11955 [Pseudaminobacter sp.]|nr:hypothetical protein [Pseudaminobacter sp.]